jgi:hypothetical protein
VYVAPLTGELTCTGSPTRRPTAPNARSACAACTSPADTTTAAAKRPRSRPIPRAPRTTHRAAVPDRNVNATSAVTAPGTADSLKKSARADPSSAAKIKPPVLLARTGGTPQRPAADHLTAPHGQKGLSAALLHIAGCRAGTTPCKNARLPMQSRFGRSTTKARWPGPKIRLPRSECRRCKSSPASGADDESTRRQVGRFPRRGPPASRRTAASGHQSDSGRGRPLAAR